MDKPQKTVQEKTSADTKAIGFDYQYYYFLYQMLHLRHGESVGYEVKDDVHISRTNGETVLIQMKHSVVTKADGNVENLTEKDEDLWKTISNWIAMINDDADERTTINLQIDFINHHLFQLVTNQSQSDSNRFIFKMSELNDGKLSVEAFKDYLSSLVKQSSERQLSTVDSYILKLREQNAVWLTAFLKRLSIYHNVDDLIFKIKQKIREKNVPETRIEDVYAAVNSRLRTLIYEDIKAGNKVHFSFENYYREFTRYFELGRTRRLPIRLNTTAPEVPQNAQEHMFITQLIDAEILSVRDDDFEEKLVECFSNKYEMHNNLTRWLHDSEITEHEKMAFDWESEKEWKNTFDRVYAEHKTKLRNQNALDTSEMEEPRGLAAVCYYETLKIKLTLDATQLPVTMCNGQYYLLSDKPSIGWLYNWKARYLV